MTEEEMRAAAAEFGRRGGIVKSEAKQAAGAINTAKARQAKAANTQNYAPCNCRSEQRTDGTHRTYCPVYKREARAIHRQKTG